MKSVYLTCNADGKPVRCIELFTKAVSVYILTTARARMTLEESSRNSDERCQMISRQEDMVPMDPDDLQAVRELIRTRGVDALTVDDLTKADILLIAWSGSRSHLRSVSEALDRVASGEMEYLAVRAPGGRPIAKGGIDYTSHEGAGTLYQLATHAALQGLGLGTRLISVAEDRIRDRGLHLAMLGVEGENHRARALYERLGYETCGSERASWEQEDADGVLHTYETELTLLKKQI